MKFFARTRHRTLLAILAVLTLGGVLQFANANPAVSQTLYLTAYEAPSDPGLDPGANVWSNVPGVRVPLTAQAGTYAAGGGSIPTVLAKAVHYNSQLFVRVEWDDSTVDDSTTRVEDFADAVALEFPAIAAATVPSICMGQADAGVNIWHWRADSQIGLREPVEVYAGAISDLNPVSDPISYTARDAGNPYANPDQGPVQNLISQTFGALTTSPVQDVQGEGAHSGNTWAVVFSRTYAGGGQDYPTFATGQTTDMAVAVWNGSEDDRNGRKSVSQFVTLSIAGAPVRSTAGTNTTVVLLAVGVLVGVTLLGAGLAFYGVSERADR